MTTTDTPAVDVRALRRTYRRRRAVEVVALADVDLAIPVGEVHGILGPNGAGKTSLCKILSTVLLPSAGSASILGFDVVKDTVHVRRRVGIVFGGERGLYTRLTARQNLRHWGALYGLTDREAKFRTAELLERVGLTDRADDRVEGFSRGMKQRLHLARGLIGDPQVVILDEPTTGMDPIAARDFRSLVAELRGEGRTLLLTTHDMVEAESVCDRVTLIDRGNLLATETPARLACWISAFERVDASGVDAGAIAAVRMLRGVSAVEAAGDVVRVETDAEGASGEVVRVLLDHGATSIRTSLPSLEEVYLQLIGDRGLEL